MAEKVIIDIDYNTDEATRNVDKLTDEIIDLTEANKRLSKSLKNVRDDTVEGQKKRRETLRLVEKNKDAIKAARKERNENIRSIKGESSAFDKLKEALEGGTGGFGKITGAAKKFIATPIGAIIAAIVTVFAALKEALNRNEAAQDKLRIITGKLGSVFNALIKALTPVVEFLIDNVLIAFEKIGNTAEKVAEKVSKFARRLGFEKVANTIDKTTEAIKNQAAATEQLTRAENELRRERRESEKIQLQAQLNAEKLRQIRDDEARSTRERIAANEELGRVLAKQTSEELKIANKTVAAAKLRIELLGETEENLDSLAEAETRVIDIQERIAGQQSEQLVNINSLNKELKEQQENDIKRIQIIEEKTQKETDVTLKGIENIKAEIAARKKQTDEDIKNEEFKQKELFNVQAQFLNQSLELLGANIDQRVNLLSDFTNEALKLAQKRAKNEKISLNDIANATKSAMAGISEFIRSRTDKELDSIDQIENKRKSQQAAILANYKGTEKERLETQRIFNEQNAILDAQLAKRAYNIELKEFKANKAIAIVEAGINTALAVTKLLAIPPLAIAAGIAGAVQVGLIASKKPPPPPTFAKGGEVKTGVFKGASHAGGGVNLHDDSGRVLANVEGGERFFVLNKNASAKIRALSDINEGTGGKAFAKRKVLQDGGEVDTQQSQQPIVARVLVEDIKTGLTDYDNVVNAGVI